MTIKALWAQALDNASPDHIEVREGSLTREEAVASVYRVIEQGRLLFASQGTKLTIKDQQFVLEVDSGAADHVGRAAPIICYGEIKPSLVEFLVPEITSSILSFARRIERDLPAEVEITITDSVERMVKKRRTATRRRSCTVSIIALIGSITACILYNKFI